MKLDQVGLWVFIAAISGLSTQASVRCANSDTSLQYAYVMRESGIPPLPGSVVGEISWRYHGTVIAHETLHEGATNEPLPLVIQWDAHSRVDLNWQVTGAFAQRIYAQKVTVERPDGSPLLTGSQITRLMDYMICTDHVNSIP